MSDYLTLIFRKPVSNLVQEVFSKQEWVAASHSHVMRDRDNYEREVVRLKEENAKLRGELDAALQSQGREDALREALEVMVEMVEMNGFGFHYAMDLARAALAQAPRAEGET